MLFDDYQKVAKTTAIYPENYKIVYPALGLAGEAGEVCEKIKKSIRDGKPLDVQQLTLELGDVLWYISAIASDAGILLDTVAQNNLLKLKSRQERSVISGSGDNR